MTNKMKVHVVAANIYFLTSVLLLFMCSGGRKKVSSFVEKMLVCLFKSVYLILTQLDMEVENIKKTFETCSIKLKDM